MEFSGVNARERKYEYTFIGFMLFYLFLVDYLTVKALFAGHGAEDALNITKFTLFGLSFTIFIMIIVLTKIMRMTGKEVPVWLDVIGFDPEKSPLRNIKFFSRIISNPVLQIVGSVFFFSILVLLASGAQQSTFGKILPFSHVQIFGQQIYPSAALALSIEPASSAETLRLIVLISFLIILNNIIYKYTNNRGLYIFLLLGVFPILGGLSHYVDHFFRYGSIDTALIATFLFGYITSLLVVVSFSIIPAIIYHQMNNAIQASFVLFSKDIVNISVFMAIVILGIITLILWLSSKDIKYEEKFPSTLN